MGPSPAADQAISRQVAPQSASFARITPAARSWLASSSFPNKCPAVVDPATSTSPRDAADKCLQEGTRGSSFRLIALPTRTSFCILSIRLLGQPRRAISRTNKRRPQKLRCHLQCIPFLVDERKAAQRWESEEQGVRCPVDSWDEAHEHRLVRLVGSLARHGASVAVAVMRSRCRWKGDASPQLERMKSVAHRVPRAGQPGNLNRSRHISVRGLLILASSGGIPRRIPARQIRGAFKRRAKYRDRSSEANVAPFPAAQQKCGSQSMPTRHNQQAKMDLHPELTNRKTTEKTQDDQSSKSSSRDPTSDLGPEALTIATHGSRQLARPRRNVWTDPRRLSTLDALFGPVTTFQRHGLRRIRLGFREQLERIKSAMH